jgi:hypothetical protein
VRKWFNIFRYIVKEGFRVLIGAIDRHQVKYMFLGWYNKM